jgi:hypothetical protein
VKVGIRGRLIYRPLNYFDIKLSQTKMGLFRFWQNVFAQPGRAEVPQVYLADDETIFSAAIEKFDCSAASS